MERNRYTLEEWHRNNHLHQKSCYYQQILTDNIINHSNKLNEQTKEIVVKNKNQTDHYLNEHLETIAFNRNEIVQQRKDISTEIEALLVYIERLKDAYKYLQDLPLNYCKKCIELRENRLGIDLVHDNVELQLLQEKQMILDTIQLLNATIEQSHEQVRRLRSVMYFIDRDLNGKDNALKIDEANSTLNQTRSDLRLHDQTSLYKSIITPDEWLQFTNDNIQRAAKELNTARQLRSNIDNLLIKSTRDLDEQSNRVNEALRDRVHDLKIVKTKLESQHSQIIRQVTELQQTIFDLEKSVADKAGFMALAQTRLDNRRQRSGIESCEDSVELSLINEINNLRNNVTQLKQMIIEAQTSLRLLLKSQIQLEDEINLKMNSLKIDEFDCLTLHQSIRYQNY